MGRRSRRKNAASSKAAESSFTGVRGKCNWQISKSPDKRLTSGLPRRKSDNKRQRYSYEVRIISPLSAPRSHTGAPTWTQAHIHNGGGNASDNASLLCSRDGKQSKTKLRKTADHQTAPNKQNQFYTNTPTLRLLMDSCQKASNWNILKGRNRPLSHCD